MALCGEVNFVFGWRIYAACYNCGVMELHPGERRRPPKPYHRRAHRRNEWLTIYLPMILGLALVLGMVTLLWQRGVGSPSVWSDISLIFLLFAVLCGSLIVLALVVALAVGVAYAVHWLPFPAQRGRQWMARADELARQGSAWSIRPIVLPKAVWAGLRAGAHALISIFRSPGRGMP